MPAQGTWNSRSPMVSLGTNNLWETTKQKEECHEERAGRGEGKEADPDSGPG